MIVRWLTAVCVLAASVFWMSECSSTGHSFEQLAAMSEPNRMAALLQQPWVGDVYAAKISHFSQFVFGSGGDAYGIARVVAVTPETISIVTGNTAWPEADAACDDLDGDFSDITWDFDEEISIKRSSLATLKSQNMILGARRLTDEEIAEYLE